MLRIVCHASLLLAGCLTASTALSSATAAERAPGEPSRTPVPVEVQWKAAAFPSTRVARLRYRELETVRLLDVQQRNSRQPKVVQVGLPRQARLEAGHGRLPSLRWMAVAGGMAARFEVRSPDALALRIGLHVDRLDDRAEFRFAGSDEPSRIVAIMRGGEISRLRDARGLFWTPSTDGESQTVEVFLPKGVPASAVRLSAPQVSHLLANSRNDFKLIKKIGESGACNVDTACRVLELGQHFVNAKNAVAHMQFVKNGATYMCSGTLLADTTPRTQIPYFYSAHHCFGEGEPVPSAMQAVANTLNTFWNYEATSCGSGVSAPRTQVSGGAQYLYSSASTDGMLLRLYNPAPAGAYFAGWSAEKMKNGTEVIGIHHPHGDAKKVSSGKVTASDGLPQHSVSWLSGTTEVGSSGSGLFTKGVDGLELRGGLYGGAASCANTGAIQNPGNYDYYSRFDMVFFNTSHYLSYDPVPRNGSAPLVPQAAVPSAAAAVHSAPPAAAQAPRAGIGRSPHRNTPARRLRADQR